MSEHQANVDPQELAKFDALARRWWDPDGEFKPLHEINPIRMGYIQERVDLADKQVLDVGCGGGVLSEAMTVAGARVTGIDMAEGPLGVARLHGLESGISVNYQLCTVEEMAAKSPGSFDVVTCLEMLEHVPDPDSVIAACAALLKPGGTLFLATINRNAKAWALAVVGAEYILGMLPKGTHEYQKFIKPSELATSLRQHNFQLQDLTGMVYNPLTKQFSLSPDVDVNYLMHATLAS